MPKRANNSTFPADFRFEGVAYFGPTEIYRNVRPRPNVTLNTFRSRMWRLSRDGALSDSSIREALYLSPQECKAKYGARRTWVQVGDKRIDLLAYYNSEESRAMVSYRTFWSRLRRGVNADTRDPVVLEHALTFSRADWISFYGGGRHKSFIYDGELYPDHRGEEFHGVSSFLKTIGRYSEKATVWSRLKAGWDLDTALSVPVEHETERKGLVYKLTRLSTGQVYVGLTQGSLDRRWAFHIMTARNGSTSKLSEAIRSDGPGGFSLEVIEAEIEAPRELKQREIFWADELEVFGEKGLNTAKAGGLGTPRGKRTEVNGETFQSLKEAAHVLGERTGLALHVVESRLRVGAPLPTKARRHSKHPDAGSNLFRRWLALLKRHPKAVDPLWKNSYDNFKADVADTFREGFELVRKDTSKPWSTTNFEWVTVQQKIEKIHGSSVRVRGVEYPSLKAVADEYGIGVSTLKDRLRRQGMSPDEAVSKPLSATSYRGSGTIVDGRVFRSKRQAILHIAKTRKITEHQAKYRFNKGEYS